MLFIFDFGSLAMFKPIHFIAGTLCAALFIQAARADLGKDTLFPEGLHDPLIAYDTIKTVGLFFVRSAFLVR